MLEIPVDGQFRACPRCGSTAVFEHPERAAGSDRNRAPGAPEQAAVWRCNACQHVERWCPQREALRDTLRMLGSNTAGLVSLLPYDAAKARSLAQVIGAHVLAAEVQIQQADAVPEAVSASVGLRFGEMLDSCSALARADFSDHDAVRAVAATLLDRIRELDRLLGAGEPGGASDLADEPRFLGFL